ncbi:hypothetical protein C1645_837420 [Glomus cerebriforme]|uniref:Uncharacterized protein n=1 Tax=Glomus cerebriforme TaxID=658196 RepID=A0A397S8T3_9GLOM|nr:hypothetical protein C1645_837420 [Glomus cerebriforme]
MSTSTAEHSSYLQKVDVQAFFELTKEELSGSPYNFPGGLAIKLAKEIKALKEKLKPLRALYGRNFSQVKKLVVNSLRNEYVMATLHITINITRDSTGEELSMRSEHEVIGDEKQTRAKSNRGLAQNIKHSELALLAVYSGKISQGSKLPLSIKFSKDALNKDSEEYQSLRNGMKKMLGVLIGLLKIGCHVSQNKLVKDENDCGDDRRDKHTITGRRSQSQSNQKSHIRSESPSRSSPAPPLSHNEDGDTGNPVEGGNNMATSSSNHYLFNNQ